ncbi:MAG: 30S ribosomal protein S16 [Candidatus Gracilibacteria bacterium]|nr:30S ribosomal protein S16 [Candidatus Gracilibacteria bacterium]MDD3119921.1 30S ribosomal protein S16 [Candidatus Gracilibacteria bacterium]MDD4530021.1 30S ribosomal protein S16 [Candidatus Gracilibacteria bacterium]
MLKIRLSRAGRKGMPFFKIVLTEHQKAAKHGFIEVLGSYNPLTKQVDLKKEEMDKYISNGAQLSESLSKILARNSSK